MQDIILQGREFYWNKKENMWPISIKGKQVTNEIGCIHTIQGYDLNYCAVIFGPEIVYRNNSIEIDREKYYDAKGKAGEFRIVEI